MYGVNWSRTSISLKVFGVEIWVLMPLILSLTIWTKETFFIGVIGTVFFSILNFLGIRFIDFFRILRRTISGKRKKHPLTYLGKYRIMNNFID